MLNKFLVAAAASLMLAVPAFAHGGYHGSYGYRAPHIGYGCGSYGFGRAASFGVGALVGGLAGAAIAPYAYRQAPPVYIQTVPAPPVVMTPYSSFGGQYVIIDGHIVEVL